MYIDTYNINGRIEEYREYRPEAFGQKPPSHSLKNQTTNKRKEEFEFNHKNIRLIYNIKTLESPDTRVTKPRNGKAKTMKTCK